MMAGVGQRPCVTSQDDCFQAYSAGIHCWNYSLELTEPFLEILKASYSKGHSLAVSVPYRCMLQ